MFKLKKLILSLPAIIITILIFILSDQAIPELFGLKFNLYDKLQHIIAFFIYGLSLLIFYLTNLRHTTNRHINIRIILLVVLTGNIYALFDEFHQSFIPGRQTEFQDWLADFTGIFLSLFFYKLLAKSVDKYLN